MPKPGRRVATPAEFKTALSRRVKFARENAGLDLGEIAAKLTKQIGREISADTYRKWEGLESSIPHDAILPFCDITKTHPYLLLAKPSEAEMAPMAALTRRAPAG
jgi:hypothetical protein